MLNGPKKMTIVETAAALECAECIQFVSSWPGGNRFLTCVNANKEVTEELRF